MADFFNLPPNGLFSEQSDEEMGWNVLKVFDNEQDAAIVKGALEAEGIPCELTNETSNAIFPIGFSSVGGVYLWVPVSMTDKALMILRKNDDEGTHCFEN